MPADGSNRAPRDPQRLLDEGSWTTYQKLLVCGTALTIVLDGIDNQLLPNAVPALIREWGYARAAFTTPLAIGPFGMMIGAFIGGVIGDRVGRRPALIGNVLLFGTLTLLIGFVSSVEALSVLRFLAGLGLGGTMPNAATLASEYVPRRQRPMAVTLTIVCVPLGGALAGQAAAFVVPAYGWHMLFLLGGAVPLLLGAVLWKVLPESPTFLVRYRERWPELTAILRRSGHDVPEGTTYLQSGRSRATVSVRTVSALFHGGLARDTAGLWAAFFFGLMVNYVVILLLPAMLTSRQVGFTQPVASGLLAVWNYGGVAGAVIGAMLVQRFGSRAAMLTMAAGGVLVGAMLAAWPLQSGPTAGLTIMLIVTGAFINAVQTTMYALAAHVYPAEIRSTGVGLAVAVGRIGNVMAAYVGSVAMDRGGPAAYFAVWSVLMLLVLVALACMKNHVPRTS